jgi:hypothetical protein
MDKTTHEALSLAANLVKTERGYFPKSMHNADKFALEQTAAAIGAALQKAKPKREPIGCKQTSCRHCGQDIEAFWPYRRGEWRDRGSNSQCPAPLRGFPGGPEGTLHAPNKGQ